jgi:hypothetical protein
MVARLQLVSESVVVARWLKYLLVIFITFRYVFIAIDDYQ